MCVCVKKQRDKRFETKQWPRASVRDREKERDKRRDCEGEMSNLAMATSFGRESIELGKKGLSRVKREERLRKRAGGARKQLEQATIACSSHGRKLPASLCGHGRADCGGGGL